MGLNNRSAGMLCENFEILQQNFLNTIKSDSVFVNPKGQPCDANSTANKDNYTTPFEDELALNHPTRFTSQYFNLNTIENSIKCNPNIKELLHSNHLEVKLNLNNINSIVMSHLIPTAKKAQTIYINMGHSKNEINYTRLTQAALLHDIGKVFIPESILNKKGKLTFSERRIVELHNALSYEILKTTNLHPLVPKLAYEHHDYENNVKKNHENQALMIADIYCALREKRPYKKPMNDFTAKVILYDMAANGKFDPSYIKYIK